MTRKRLFSVILRSRLRAKHFVAHYEPLSQRSIHMRTWITAAFLASALVPTTAFAQDEDGGRQIKYKARTEIDFEGVDVSGELIKPSGALLLDRKKADFNPLIRLREDFSEEIKQSVDEVK